MKLLVATPLYPPDHGGPATYAALLQQGLSKEDIQVTTVVFSHVRHLPKVVRHATYFWNVFIAAYGVDIVLALDSVSVGLPARLAALVRRKSFVVKVVGDYAWEQGVQRWGITDTLDTFVRRGRVPTAVAALRAIQHFVTRTATHVIVPSNYLKDIVLQWRVQKEKVTVIYNAVEIGTVGTVPAAVAALPHNRVVSIGRMVPWKGMPEVISAVAAHNRGSVTGEHTAPLATLTLVGDGPDFTSVAVQAQHELGVWAVCTGALSHEDALATLKSADVFVLNSSYEGLSHVLIEAMLLGKCIIATNIGGNGELITHEKEGILIPAHDAAALQTALTDVLADASLREKYGHAAKLRASMFMPEAMLAQTARTLTAVVAG